VNALDTLLVISLLTVVVAFVMGNRPVAGWSATLLYGVQLVLLLSIAGLGYGSLTSIESSLTFHIMGNQLHWHFDALSWFFALITLCAALFCSWFASGPWARDYRDSGRSLRLFNSAIALNVFAMLLLLASGDFLTLFIGWEAVSWASFLLMAISGPRATRYALRYLVYAFGGAMAVLMGLVMVHAEVGSFEFDALQRHRLVAGAAVRRRVCRQDGIAAVSPLAGQGLCRDPGTGCGLPGQHFIAHGAVRHPAGAGAVDRAWPPG